MRLAFPLPQTARQHAATDPARWAVVEFRRHAGGAVCGHLLCRGVQFVDRSRFAPSTHSLLAVCPVPWLLSPVAKNDPTPRWQVTGVCESEPVRDLVMPVRDVKVMYALKSHHYQGFAKHQIAHAHEYFVPMDAITAEDCHENPAIRALVARSAVSANFLGAA